MLLITGAADRTVDPGNTARLAAAIAAHDGVATVTTYPRIRHIGTVAALATATPWRKPAIRDAMIDFINKRVAELGME